VRVVVDTSSWIDYGRGRLTSDERKAIETAWRNADCILYQWVWLELVVGFRSPAERRALDDYRAISKWEPLNAADATRAEQLADGLRDRGRNVGAADLLIVAAAERLGAQLMHRDSDFDAVLEDPQLRALRWSAQTR
jgi:predicted nucleic acid-binding protein